MRKTNKLFKVRWGTYVFYSDIHKYVLIGKASSLVVYETENNGIVLSTKFKYTSRALESRKHNCVLVANTLGQIIRIDYQTNTSTLLKQKAGEIRECFLSQNEDYAVFISLDRNVLVVDINTFEKVTFYSYREVFGEISSIKFINNLTSPTEYEFAVWNGGIDKLRAVSFDIINRSFVEIRNPSLQVLYENKEMCQFVYAPELDCYVSLYDKGDYFHVKIIQDGGDIFSFNTNYEAWARLKIIYRKEDEAYICLSYETIFLFDFANRIIKKIYRSTTNDIMASAYNKRDDEFVLIYAFDTSDTITIDDFSDFSGFDT